MSDLQSSLNFYIKISSTNGIKTVEKLRTYFFNNFLREECSQMETLLEEKRKLEERKKQELLQKEKQKKEEELLEERNTMDVVEDTEEYKEELEVTQNENFSSVDFLGLIRNSTKTSDAVEEEDDPFSSNFFNSNNSVKYVEHGVILDDIVNISYVEHGIYLDEIEIIDTKVGSKSNEIQLEYVEHGIFLDEIEVSFESSDVLEENTEGILEESTKNILLDSITPSKGYVEHGIFLDDLESASELEDSYTEVEDEVEIEDEVKVENVEEYDYVPHGVILDDLFNEVNSTTKEDIPDDSLEEDESSEEVDEDFSNMVEDLEEEEDELEESPQLEYNSSNVLDRFFGGTLDDKSNFSESILKQATEQEKPIPVVHKEEQVIEVPQDIRLFIKKHPNSSIDFVSKYYSKKEIDRAIKLGRIYKKKNKLMI